MTHFGRLTVLGIAFFIFCFCTYDELLLLLQYVIPLSDDKHQFVQKVHPACPNGHWERGRNSNSVATLPHAAFVSYATI